MAAVAARVARIRRRLLAKADKGPLAAPWQIAGISVHAPWRCVPWLKYGRPRGFRERRLHRPHPGRHRHLRAAAIAPAAPPLHPPLVGVLSRRHRSRRHARNQVQGYTERFRAQCPLRVISGRSAGSRWMSAPSHKRTFGSTHRRHRPSRPRGLIRPSLWMGGLQPDQPFPITVPGLT